jgi:hypothetical protein
LTAIVIATPTWEIAMDASNLQIQGVCMAVAALQRLLIAKGLATAEEIDAALHFAEAAIISSDRAIETLPPAQRDAAAFPIRLLRCAAQQSMADPLDFSELAARVGRTKPIYNDQQ